MNVLDRIFRLEENGTTSTSLSAVAGLPNSALLVESAVGVREGARTGLSSVTAGLLFLVAAPFAPLLSVIPGSATAAALMYALR